MQFPEKVMDMGVDDAHISPIYFWQLFYFLKISGISVVDVGANRLVRSTNLVGRWLENLLAAVIKKNIQSRKFPDHGVTSEAMLFGDCFILECKKKSS
jgi:hypothetical protein